MAYLSGGMVEWERAGLPIAKDVDYEMIGGCACRIHARVKAIVDTKNLKE